MNELDAVLADWRGGVDDPVLATVVHVEGSAYRRPGARMLLRPGGAQVGTLSGGCLEGEVRRKAWWFTDGGRPCLRIYDTRSDDDAVWEFGLGCNGVIHVLLERAESAGPCLEFLARCRRSGQPAAVATLVEDGPQLGRRLWRSADGALGGDLVGTPYEPELRSHLERAVRDRSGHLAHLPDNRAFVEWVPLPPHLSIVGAGHDAVPLVALASQLGWRVSVADPHARVARPDRFPGAERVVALRDDDPRDALGLDEESLVVLMTHSYPRDSCLLADLVPLRTRYLGLLGPRQRAERLFAENGFALDDHPQVHAPVGLDLGADTPESIALSVVAEIQARLAGRNGGPLRERVGQIHAPVDEIGARRTGRAGATVAPVCELAR